MLPIVNYIDQNVIIRKLTNIIFNKKKLSKISFSFYFRHGEKYAVELP